jgi:hypothetical protein
MMSPTLNMDFEALDKIQGDTGHFAVWYPETDTRRIQSFGTTSHNLALKPSRQALYNVIKNQGWNIISYYDYQDFQGHGESPPRRQGLKDFYLLENPR